MLQKSFVRLLTLALIVLIQTGCSEFVRVQKSTDTSLKYSYAKKYYNDKKYGRAIELLEDVVPLYNGTSEGSQSLYLLADSYYKSKREITAADYFRRYYTLYPKAEMAEEALFKAGYGLYKSSPDPRLDQAETYDAIRELQLYMEMYPKSPRIEETRKLLFEMQDKLAMKEYLAAKLYYNLGLYMGNNYRSAVVTASDALKAYPYSKVCEDLQFLVLQSTYKEAANSVDTKLQTRLRDVLDCYYAYSNRFPNGKYSREAKQIFDDISKKISKNA